MICDISNRAKLPTIYGEFLVQAFKQNDKEHLVIYTKNMPKTPNVRIHSECLTGDAISSIKCDCQAQLNFALDYINTHGGAVIYLRQEGRGIGLFNKIQAYALQDTGLDTVQANHQLGFDDDMRDYKIVDFILDYYKIKQINLLTNNPRKISAIKIKIIKTIPIHTNPTTKNKDYLNIKKTKLGHSL
ncbi:MAG: GTP cyclohydrolase II [Epsilonproteobacteria bacterium]|nr:MAG: GTP cyclohydrolase II [Campylobacterota bacterium]